MPEHERHRAPVRAAQYKETIFSIAENQPFLPASTAKQIDLLFQTSRDVRARGDRLDTSVTCTYRSGNVGV
ncbi:hypothetical protein [Rhodococcus sp. (in: high G+C Gram-positive bacteria)]|uniref:hypothetical protein n=1 Tax=Rhodococcus sp. TaxID=1831 RepID=UPI00388E3478